MRPLKFKELLPEIAKRSGHDQQLVENLLGFYWQTVRTQLSTLKDSQIQILNLGTFIVKPLSLTTKLQRRRSFFQRMQGNSNAKQSIRNDVENEIVMMEKIVDMRTAEEERRRCIRKPKKLYETYLECDPHLEKKKPNL